MKLNLTQAQLKKASKNLPFQVKHAQLGSGMDFNLHPMNIKKVMKAYNGNKGVRLTLSGGELEMDGGSIFGSIGKSISKTFAPVKKAVAPVKKVLKPVGKTITKTAKKYITEDNAKKYGLKGYNMANKELEKQGMQSIHGAVLENGLGYVPFVPQSVKSVGAHYAEKYIDRELAKESKRVGAGFKSKYNASVRPYSVGRGVNPYIPTGLISKTGGSIDMSSNKKTYSDLNSYLRPNQAGFKATSVQSADKMTTKGGSFTNQRNIGGSFSLR